jgi:DNA mismatch endonuclease (patch repair protein)
MAWLESQPDTVTRIRMRRQKRTGTSPEIALRSAAWALGLRYRVDAALPIAGVRRRADMLFVGARIAVFIDGCYWHSCPLHATVPKSNTEWWLEKLARNVQRDRDTDERLGEIGWLSLRFWEHDDPIAAADRVRSAVLARQTKRTRPG